MLSFQLSFLSYSRDNRRRQSSPDVLGPGRARGAAVSVGQSPFLDVLIGPGFVWFWVFLRLVFFSSITPSLTG